MFDDLRDLYQDVVMDRGRKPRHQRRLEAFDATARGDNPMCGDRVQIWIKYAGDGTIADAGFEARGCAISIASADLMVEAVTGGAPESARRLSAAFEQLARTGVCPECELAVRDGLEQLKPLSGVHAYPSRVKCATLPWRALIAAVDGERETTSE